MTDTIIFIYFVIAIAFLFELINGFHDASNSIATIVTTGVLKPKWAVLWAASFNFIAFFVFHLHVATTLATGLVSPAALTPYVILAALVGAIIFNLCTWYLGLPSSSSHALIGGLIGAVLAHAGWHSLEFSGLSKVIIAIILSPFLGMILAYLLIALGRKLSHYQADKKISKWSGKLQLASSALLSLGHGGNDAQKTMGIIAGLLFSANLLGTNFYVPLWVVFSCYAVMALGTLMGGWRIVRTLGEKITHIEPLSGAAVETGSAITLFLANYLGIPVSTTHTVTGAVTGVGIYGGRFATNWKVVSRIIFGWLLTIPMAALIAAGLIFIKNFLF